MDLIKNIDFWALVVALGSVVWTYFNSKKLNKQQMLLNEMSIEKAVNEKKTEDYADIMVEVKKEVINYNHPIYKVYFTNKGKGTARRIKLSFDKNIAKSKGLYFTHTDEEIFPLLNEGDGFNMIVFFEEGHDNVFEIGLIWDDSRVEVKKDQALYFA